MCRPPAPSASAVRQRRPPMDNINRQQTTHHQSWLRHMECACYFGGPPMSFPRYPKYKPSGVEWLGDVPEHWAVIPCRAIVHERTAKIDGLALHE